MLFLGELGIEGGQGDGVTHSVIPSVVALCLPPGQYPLASRLHNTTTNRRTREGGFSGGGSLSSDNASKQRVDWGSHCEGYGIYIDQIADGSCLITVTL